MNKDWQNESDFNLKQDGVISTSDDFYENLMKRVASQDIKDTSAIKTKYSAIAVIIIFLALNTGIAYSYLFSSSSKENSPQTELQDQLFGTVEVYSY